MCKCAHGCDGRRARQGRRCSTSPQAAWPPADGANAIAAAATFVAGVFDGIADEAERERFEAAALAKLEGLA
jgi:hypothetical protein